MDKVLVHHDSFDTYNTDVQEGDKRLVKKIKL